MPVPRPVTVVLALALLLPAPGAHARKKGGKKRKPKVHVVQEGDILGDIAARHGCSIAELKAANRLERDLIRIGDRLTVPRCSGRRQPHAGEGRSRVVRHTVIPGETLGSIARRHGTTIDAIQRRNRLDGHVIRAGQVLKVRARIPVRQRREFVYTVKRGDTLGKIGARYKMEWEDIRRMNPGVRPRRLRVGDRLRLWRDGPVPNSEAVGRPQEGRLVNGEQLPAGPGYYRRRPGRSWGTNETITRLLQVIATVRRKHRRLHDIAIGDLSAKKGGPLPGHASHQSGRDVDIGLLHARYPSPRPKGFIKPGKRHPLDYPAMWTLLTALVGSSDADANVEYVFLDRRLQRRIYDWARDSGKPKKLLDRMFQYPDGRGVVRHEPRHDDHVHVRFRCPKRNPACR